MEEVTKPKQSVDDNHIENEKGEKSDNLFFFLSPFKHTSYLIEFYRMRVVCALRCVNPELNASCRVAFCFVCSHHTW